MRRRPSCTPGPVAFHEAGHVIACWKLESPIQYATIIADPTRGFNGVVYHDGPPRQDRLEYQRRSAVISFAGAAAQRIAHPRSAIREGASVDDAWSDLRAEVLFQAMHSRQGFLRDADREARGLVEQHWFAVDRVARELTAHQAASGWSLMPIIEEAEAEWQAAAAARPGLAPIAYTRERAIAAQGLPPLRRSHLAGAALRASLAGAADIEAAVVADLAARGYAASAVITELTRAKEALAA